MKSHEFIQAAADMLSAFGGAGTQANSTPDNTASGKLHAVEPEYDDNTDTTTMVAPLQQKLELLKKAVDVDSYYDSNNPGYDPGPGEGTREPDEIDQMKKLAGVMFNAGDDSDAVEA